MQWLKKKAMIMKSGLSCGFHGGVGCCNKGEKDCAHIPSFS